MHPRLSHSSVFPATLLLAVFAGCDTPPPTAQEEASTGEFDELGESSGDAAFDPGLDAFDAPTDDDVHEINAGPNTTVDTNVNPRWAEVVQLRTGSGRCSGTLISPVHVLTAGHCASTTSTLVALDTPATGTAAEATYGVVQVKTLSTAAGSGRDLQVLVLDEAVPSFGQEGAPLYSVAPATGFSNLWNLVTLHAVGYGPEDGCTQTTGLGTRSGVRYNGGFKEYAGFPGVITRPNRPCSDALKGPLPGDSGGPLLDPGGRVVGVFSGWSCRTSTGATASGSQCNDSVANTLGTIEWTAVRDDNRTWVETAMTGDFDGDGVPDLSDPLPGVNCNGAGAPSACTGIKPDFSVTSIRNGGCTGDGRPMVEVTIVNEGPATAATWIDFFVGLASAPTPGTLSSEYLYSTSLRERQTQTVYFVAETSDPSPWVDVIVDTTFDHAELSETNNVRSAHVVLSDCSFG